VKNLKIISEKNYVINYGFIYFFVQNRVACMKMYCFAMTNGLLSTCCHVIMC